MGICEKRTGAVQASEREVDHDAAVVAAWLAAVPMVVPSTSSVVALRSKHRQKGAKGQVSQCMRTSGLERDRPLLTPRTTTRRTAVVVLQPLHDAVQMELVTALAEHCWQTESERVE